MGNDMEPVLYSSPRSCKRCNVDGVLRRKTGEEAGCGMSSMSIGSDGLRRFKKHARKEGVTT